MNLAVGFFDGVHLGHRSILAHADEALTFLSHPASVFAPDRAPPLLMSAEMRLSAIADALGHVSTSGRNPVRAIPFTAGFAASTPEDFADWLHREYPDLDTVFCGPNWTFGAKGAGDASTLRSFGFRVTAVPFVEMGGRPISSTRIRTALAAGQLDEASNLLGHYHSVEGTVFSGKGLGRQIGFPTINLTIPNGLVKLPAGVYDVITPFGPGVANCGLAPTLEERRWNVPVLEVHLTAPPADLSVQSSMVVTFRRFIRPERKFPSLDELRAQIARDIDTVRSGQGY